MWLDALALVLLGAFAGIGALRGPLAGALGLLGLVAGYVVAGFAAGHYGTPAAAWLGLPEWMGMALAGTAGFALVSLASGLSLAGLRRFRLLGHRLDASPRQRFAGALFGGLRGALVVLLLGNLACWVDALRVAGVAPSLPVLGDSVTALASSHAVEAGLEAALPASPTRRVVARIAARPGASIASLREVMEHPRIAALRDDAAFWTEVENGAVDAAMNRSSFLGLAGDDALLGRLAELGVIEGDAAQEPAAFREAASRVLQEAGPRLRALRRDPEFQGLVQDPVVLALVQQGDTLGLLANARFRHVVTRVASSENR